MAPGEHNAVVHGVRLWYKVAGSPRPAQAPVLYLAGGPGYNSYSFEKTIGARLEQHAQILYFDERGTGRSERPVDRDYDLQTLTADIDGLREQLGLAQLNVMGQSFGGTLALEYAARYPQHVQKLILIDAAINVPEIFKHWQDEIATRYPQQFSAEMTTPAGAALTQAESGSDACAVSKARFVAEQAVLAQVDGADFHHWQQFHNQRFREEQDQLDAASGLRNTGEMAQVYFSPDSSFLCYRFTQGEKLTFPVLVIAGKYDGAVDPAQAAALAAHLPNAQYDEFQNSAHFPYAEEPVRFTADVVAFLSAPIIPPKR